MSPAIMSGSSTDCKRPGRKAFATAILTPLLISAIFICLGTQASADAGNYIGFLSLDAYGSASSYPGSQECAFGSFTADAVREAAGTDIAVVNAGELASSLKSGDVYQEDVYSVFSENLDVAVAQISGEQLKSILETSVGHVIVDPQSERIDRDLSDYDGFAQISGFSFKYDASAPLGSRVLSAELADGTPVDLSSDDQILTIAASAEMLSGKYGYESISHERLQYGLVDALAEYISQSEPEQDSGGYAGRIKVIGARENQITAALPTSLLLAGCAVLAGFCVLFRMKLKRL